MKIGYFTDIHFHKHKPFSGQDGRRRLEDTYYILQDILGIFDREGCDCIIFGGDWFHSRRSIDVDTFNTSRECLMSFEDELDNIKHKFAIAGNHDFYDDSGSICSIDFLDDFGFNVMTSPEMVHIEDVTLCFLPWASIKEQIEGLNSFGRKRIYPSKQVMLFAHTTPFGSSSPMGYVFEDGIDFENDEHGTMFDRIFCGHIHKHQHMNRVYIPGPPLQLHFGERDNHCGVYIYDSIKDKAKFHSLKGKYPEFVICRGMKEYNKVSNDKDYFRVIVDDIPDGKFNDRVEFVVESNNKKEISNKMIEVGLSREEMIIEYGNRLEPQFSLDRNKLVDIGLNLICDSED